MNFSSTMSCREDFSIWYCRQHFGHYARFAVLRLHTAVMRQDHYCLSGFESSFRFSGKDHEKNPTMQNFMTNLDYADAEHFSTDELRFYLRAAYSYKSLTEEEIELERQQIKRHSDTDMVLESHAEYLLKAIEYWKMHFKEKIGEWRQESAEATRGWTLRRKLADGDITPREAETGIIVEDDGYCSGDDSDEEE
jgi:hypothetical protein